MCDPGKTYFPCGSGESPSCDSAVAGNGVEVAEGEEDTAQEDEEDELCIEGCYCAKGTFLQVRSPGLFQKEYIKSVKLLHVPPMVGT